jgi:hypothetical protein
VLPVRPTTAPKTPPEQIVDSRDSTAYGYEKDGKPILTKAPKLLLNAIFTQALFDQAKKRDWTVIRMKNGWKRIVGFER